MKSTMILCALAAVCCFSTGNAANNAGTAALTRLKSEVQSTTNDLTRYGRNLVFNTRSKLSDLKIVELTNINSIVNPALAAIRSEIDQAKAAGKNADHCFEPSRQRMRLASLNSWKVLDQCASDALATIDPVKNNVDALLQLGNRLTSELDAIAINCMSSNAMATQNCIVAKIPEASSTVNNYRNTASSLKQTGDRASSDAQNSGRSCYQGGVQTVRDETNGARADAHQCVANA